MSILDRYVARNFIVGYIIAATVSVGLCVVIDLFVNLGEFAEQADLGPWQVIGNIFIYYGIQSSLYFRDFAGMITVIAAVFSLGKMTRNNELIAVMASGVSLKRVIAPIVVLAMLLTGLLVVDQEIIIPRLAHRLIRPPDAKPGDERYEIWYMVDGNGSLICTKQFDEKTQTMIKPYIICRREITPTRWEVVGKIEAEKATYNEKAGGWDLTGGVYLRISGVDHNNATQKLEPVAFYETDITPTTIPMRQQEGYKSLLSSRQLSALARHRGTRMKDQADLILQKHSRVTDPIINMVMLMVALPVLVCRDPKAMKSAIMISFGITLSCIIVSFVCKIFATEMFFGQVRPELWAWGPVFIFLPIAFIEIDSMKT